MRSIVLQMSSVLSECSLSLWLHNLKPTYHTVSYFMRYRSITQGIWERFTKRGIRGCKCCLGDIVLYCMLSLTSSKFVWTCVWSISTFYSFFFFLHGNLTEIEGQILSTALDLVASTWTLERTAPCLCLRVSTSISECRLFTDRQKGECGTMGDKVGSLNKVNMCHCVLLYTGCGNFTILKPLPCRVQIAIFTVMIKR